MNSSVDSSSSVTQGQLVGHRRGVNLRNKMASKKNIQRLLYHLLRHFVSRVYTSTVPHQLPQGQFENVDRLAHKSSSYQEELSKRRSSVVFSLPSPPLDRGLLVHQKPETDFQKVFSVELTNRKWFSVVCTLINNGIRHYSGQNVVDSRGAAE